MYIWKIEVLPNSAVGQPCHTVLVRAATSEEAQRLAVEGAKANEVVHDDPRALSACIATEQEARQIRADQTIVTIEYKHAAN